MSSAATPVGWSLVSGERTVRSWAELLPRASGSALAARAERDRLRQRVRAGFPEERLQQLAASFEPWWPVRPRRSQGLELVIVHQDGRREKLVFFHRTVRIGRDSSCQLQLHADTVSSQHCEIRLEDDRLWLVDLASSNGTKVNDFDLVAFEPRPLVAGDQVHVRPFRLVVGSHEAAAAPPRVAMTIGEPLTAEGPSPFAALAGPQSLWVRVQAGEHHGFVRIPATWLRFAYTTLGYEPPPPPAAPFGNDIDLSLTSFLLQQVAAEATQRIGMPVSLSAVLPPPRMAALAGGTERWEGARFALIVGEDRHELEALWPAADATARPSRPAADWVMGLQFAVGVSAGILRLAASELTQLDRGDILVPDSWLPAGFADPQSPSLGPAMLVLQGWSSRGELRFEKGYYHLHIASPWRVAPKGAFMAENAALPEGMEGAPVRLPDELEALVSFELERIAVPLKELLAWEPGATVRLQRAPEDPVRIVLRQGGQERLLGYGRVVVVDERIGVQIERWLVEAQGG